MVVIVCLCFVRFYSNIFKYTKYLLWHFFNPRDKIFKIPTSVLWCNANKIVWIDMWTFQKVQWIEGVIAESTFGFLVASFFFHKSINISNDQM